MVFPIILLSISFLLVGYFSYEKCKAYSLKAVFLKAASSMLFIAVGAYAFSQTTLTIFPIFAIIGLAFGMLGDIFLDLKYVYKENDYEFSMAGFSVFGLGHILYVTGMFLEFYHGQNVLYIIIPLIIGVLMGPVTLLVSKLSGVKYGKFKTIALLYAMTLFSTVATAFSMWMASGFTHHGLLLLFIGGILFAVSDLILNMTYFAENHEKPFDIISNTLTYYAAQFLIALSIMIV